MDTEKANEGFRGEYRLDVRNFGPIAKASVDLRPLTVFIGPSNTGKSYLAILLYALHQCFGAGNVGPYALHPRSRNRFLGSIYGSLRESDDDASGLLESFRNWLQDQFHSNTQPKSPIDLDSDVEHESTPERPLSLGPLPQDIAAYFRSTFERAVGLGHYAESEIGRCFGVEDIAALIGRSNSCSSANVKISIPRANDAGIVGYGISLEEDGVALSGDIGGRTSLSGEMNQLGDFDDMSLYIGRLVSAGGVDSEDASYALARVADDLFSVLLKPLYRSAYYLPADRTGVMHSHQVVVSTLVQNAATAGLRPSASIPILSGVLADFLSQLIEMSGERRRFRTRSRRRVPQSDDRLARRIEESVLRGAIHMESSEGGYPSFNFRPDGWDENLPLMRASSMVSELAPVVLYLRHLVRLDDVLIIEEPESHLHPAMQVEFTRQLAALVQAGIRVIVTTHSEWLLQELANLVRLSQVPECEREGITGGNVALDGSDVGAWLFRFEVPGEGSIVSEVGLDDSGLYQSDFDDVAVALHNDWAEISSRLGEDQ